MHRELLLLIAIADLGLAYLSWTSQQYLSPLAMLLDFLLALSAAALFLFPFTDTFNSMQKRVKDILAAASLLALLVLMYLNAAYDQMSSASLALAVHAAMFVTVAVAITVASLYLIGMADRRMAGLSRPVAYALLACMLVAASAAAYTSMYGFSSNRQWNGVDELAFNYYSSQLFLQGKNPYTQSMEPILESKGIFPTIQLDGQYEFAYAYPALSFLIYVPAVAAGITTLFTFIALLIFLAVAASFIVYRSSGYSKLSLIPITMWIALSYMLVSVSNTYLAVSVFLLLAFLTRKRLVMSGAFLGLAASTTQLVWFALPFFYVMTLRDDGLKKALVQAGASAALFLAVNAYFIILSPGTTLGNTFLLFLTSKLVPYGANLMQFMIAFYPVPYTFSTLLSGLVLVASLAVLYFYGRSAMPLLAVAPAMIFFLAWRNISIYGIPYVPLLLAIYYSDAGKEAQNIAKSALPVVVAIASIALVAIVAAVAMHAAYSSNQLIRINSLTPRIYVNGTSFSLQGIVINVTNNETVAQNVSFYLLSRSPADNAYLLSYLLPSVKARSSSSYLFSYPLTPIDNSTRLFVIAFSKDYMASKELDLNLSYPR